MHTHWEECLNVKKLLSEGYRVMVISDGALPRKHEDLFNCAGCVWIDGVSYEIMRVLPSNSVDCALVDTDHNYVTLKWELEQLERIVKKGGLVILHDTVTYAKENGSMPDGYTGESRGKSPYPHKEIAEATRKGLGMIDAIQEVIDAGLFVKIAESQERQGAMALRRI